MAAKESKGRSPVRLGFLASHRGSNMQAVINACKSSRIEAQAAVVISNNRNSQALARAGQEGIPAYHLSGTTHPDPGRLDRAICETLREHGVNLVVLAGYMKMIGLKTLRAFRGRIVNIHPGLLPKYGGKGMFGMNVHDAVIAAGDRETGITVHVVDGGYDTGPVLAERRVRVMKGDTAESLSERMLPLEHELYVDTIARIARGELELPRMKDRGRRSR